MAYDRDDPATREWDAFIETMFDALIIAVGAHLLWIGVELGVTVWPWPAWSEHGPQLWLLMVLVLVVPPGLWWTHRRLRARRELGAFSPALQLPAAVLALVAGALLAGSIPIWLRDTWWAGVRDSGSWFFLCVANALWAWWALRLCGSRKSVAGWPPQRQAPARAEVKGRRQRR